MNDMNVLSNLGHSEAFAVGVDEGLMYDALTQVQNAMLYSLPDAATEFDWNLPVLRKSIARGTFPAGIELLGKRFWLHDELVAIRFARKHKWSTWKMKKLVSRIYARRPGLRDWIIKGLDVIWLSNSREFES